MASSKASSRPPAGKPATAISKSKSKPSTLSKPSTKRTNNGSLAPSETRYSAEVDFTTSTTLDSGSAGRKRKVEEDLDADTASAQDIFRRHFELAFEPLPEDNVRQEGRETRRNIKIDGDENGGLNDAEEDGLDTDDDFGGFSDDDEDDYDDDVDLMQNPGVEVVDHSKPAAIAESMTKQASRAFMSARPPSPTSAKRKLLPTTTAPPAKSTDPEDSADLVANDIALQRLLSESHLLLEQSASTHPIFSPSLATHIAPTPKHKLRAEPHYDPSLFSSGRARLRAIDLHLQTLGASGGSLYARPKSGRSVSTLHAMAQAERSRENRRRREAQETGLVLERKGGKSGALVGMDKKRRRR